MTNSAKKHWMVVLAYGGLLCISLIVFLKEPNWRIGLTAWNGLFQLVGPTIGTFVLMTVIVIQMARKKISLASGICAIVFLAAVSYMCLAFTIPIMMLI